MGSKLVIILDDLLWVLTDSQLKAALHFLDSLAGLVQKATNVTRKIKAARKLEVLFPSSNLMSSKIISNVYRNFQNNARKHHNKAGSRRAIYLSRKFLPSSTWLRRPIIFFLIKLFYIYVMIREVQSVCSLCIYF